MKSAVMIAISMLLNSTGYAGSRTIEFTQEFHPAPQALVELWIPTPLERTGYQKLNSRMFSGNATSINVVAESNSPSPHIYVRWENVKSPEFKIVNVVEISDRNETSANYPDQGVDQYLAPTKHVQTDGVVKETADKITSGIADPDQKAKAIYNWIVEKTVRDPKVRGCGLGDVKSTLAFGNLSGKCADLNSLFVGLARAAGIPAREVFGQRVAKSEYSSSLGKEGDNSKAQHCRAEFYSRAKSSWIPVDPGDVRKYILEENLKISDSKVTALREKFFGFWEGNWVAFNYARDFKLEGYQAGNLNYFLYPLLASGAVRPDGVDPSETGYKFTTKAVNE